MTVIITGVWVLAICARFLCAVSLVRRGLARAYWPLLAAAIATGLSQAAGLLIWWIAGAEAYTKAWFSFGQHQIWWDTLIVVAVIRSAASHFPKVFWFATAVSVVFAALSLALALPISRLASPLPKFVLESATFVVRNYATFLLALVGLTVFFFSRLGGDAELRRNSLRLMETTAVMFTLAFVGAGIYSASEGSYNMRAAAQLIIVGGPMLCYSAYAALLTSAGERWQGFPADANRGA